MIHSELALIYAGQVASTPVSTTTVKRFAAKSETGTATALGRSATTSPSLAQYGRFGDALLYAQAALRDYKQVGAGATEKSTPQSGSSR